MLKIIRFLCGYVVFTVKGSVPEVFINKATKSGVRLFNIKKQKEFLYCSVIASEYFALRRIAKQSCVKLKIKNKCGFPFFVRLYKKRKGIFVGIICFGLTLYFLSLYVWSIDINGLEATDKNQLNTLINGLGICTGTLKSEIDPPMIEKIIMNKISNISWVSVNIKGSILSFEIKEKVEAPQIIPKTTPCNVKANNDGQIIRMEVYEGTPEIKNGDAVVKGQLLINGFVEDDFATCNIRHADAKVFALTKHSLKKEVDLCQTQRQKTGKVVERKRLKLFGIELPLTLTTIPGADFEKNVKIKNALKELESAVIFCKNSGYEKLRVDFSLVSDMNYYNGIIFRGYVKEIPTRVISGGQYDNLMKKMGKNSKAVGFAVYLDLTERLKKDDSADVDVLLIYSNSDDPLKVIKAVNVFIEKGESVAAYNYVPEKLTYLRKVCLCEIE